MDFGGITAGFETIGVGVTSCEEVGVCDGVGISSLGGEVGWVTSLFFLPPLGKLKV